MGDARLFPARSHPAVRLVAGRLTLSAVSVLAAASIVFWAVTLLPGDAAEHLLGRDATPAALAALRARLHLDHPAGQRFLEWLASILHGNFGLSMASGSPVLPYVARSLGNTLLLTGLTLLLHVPLSVGLGLLLATARRNGASDLLLSLAVLVGMSIPEFVVGVFLIWLFSGVLSWLPPLALVDQAHDVTDLLRMLALPVLTLNFAVTAYVVRQTRGMMIEILGSDYVQMARLRGVSNARVLFVHALPSALGPVINAIALNASWMIGGVVVVETVFNFPGLGRLVVDSIAYQDIPMIQGATIALSATYIALNLFADLCSLLLNPKLRNAG